MKKIVVFLLFAGLFSYAWGQQSRSVSETSDAAQAYTGKFFYQYAVKVVQGTVMPNAKPITIGPGTYYTKVNVHNPWNKPVKFKVKLVLSGPDGVQGPPPSAYHLYKLEPDYATEFSQDAFQQIFMKPIPRCFEGFLVILTLDPLDVISVYTGSAGSSLATMYMERVNPRQLTMYDIPANFKIE